MILFKMCNRCLLKIDAVSNLELATVEHVEPGTCDNIQKGRHHVLAKVDPKKIDFLGKAAGQSPAGTVIQPLAGLKNDQT